MDVGVVWTGPGCWAQTGRGWTGGICSEVGELRASSTGARTTPRTSRRADISRSPVARPDRTPPRWPPVTPASGSPAVSSAPVRIDFAGSERPTLGVEWEFALVDVASSDLSNEAAAVITEIGATPPVHKELLRNTIEVVTGAVP